MAGTTGSRNAPGVGTPEKRVGVWSSDSVHGQSGPVSVEQRKVTTVDSLGETTRTKGREINGVWSFYTLVKYSLDTHTHSHSHTETRTDTRSHTHKIGSPSTEGILVRVVRRGWGRDSRYR